MLHCNGSINIFCCESVQDLFKHLFFLQYTVAIDSGFRNSGITVGRGGKITMVRTLLL